MSALDAILAGTCLDHGARHDDVNTATAPREHRSDPADAAAGTVLRSGVPSLEYWLDMNA